MRFGVSLDGMLVREERSARIAVNEGKGEEMVKV